MFENISYLKKNKILDITNNTNSVKKDSVFFALKGNQSDGNKFIPLAIKKGAKIIVSSDKKVLKEIKNKDIVTIYTANVRSTYISECCRIFKNPSKKLDICGITGTNGKTSILYLLRHIWESKKTSILGTIENSIGQKKNTSDLTTPDSFEINNLMSKTIGKKIKKLFMEVSSHALDQSRVENIHFNSAIYTNLTRDHFDYHKNIKNYFDSKKSLFTKFLLMSSKKKKMALINIDDKYGKILFKEKLIGVTKVSYSIKNKKADFFINKISKSKNSYILDIKNREKIYSVETPLFGIFNFQNILAAFSYSIMKGKSSKKIIEKLKKFKGARGRMESVGNKQKKIFIDYAHTHDALEKTLIALREEFKSYKIIIVFGCGGERDKLKRKEMGKIAYKYSDKIILTNDNPRNESADQIIRDIKKGIKKLSNTYTIISRKKAIEYGIKKISKKTILLIAGKGHEEYQEINNKKFPFSDHQIVKESLESANF